MPRSLPATGPRTVITLAIEASGEPLTRQSLDQHHDRGEEDHAEDGERRAQDGADDGSGRHHEDRRQQVAEPAAPEGEEPLDRGGNLPAAVTEEGRPRPQEGQPHGAHADQDEDAEGSHYFDT